MTQLVSAVSIFDQMDTDGTEKLDRRELYEKVIQVVDQHMEGRTDRKGKKVPCTQADKDNISMVPVPQQRPRGSSIVRLEGKHQRLQYRQISSWYLPRGNTETGAGLLVAVRLWLIS